MPSDQTSFKPRTAQVHKARLKENEKPSRIPKDPKKKRNRDRSPDHKVVARLESSISSDDEDDEDRIITSDSKRDQSEDLLDTKNNILQGVKKGLKDIKDYTEKTQTAIQIVSNLLGKL